AARAIRTSDPAHLGDLRRLLAEAAADGPAAIAALIRLLLFRPFGAPAPGGLCRAAGRGTRREFGRVGRPGEALRDKDPQALSAIAQAYGPSMPDLAGRCTALAARFGAQGTRSEAGREGRGELTARERQISALIVAGRSNA